MCPDDSFFDAIVIFDKHTVFVHFSTALNITDPDADLHNPDMLSGPVHFIRGMHFVPCKHFFGWRCWHSLLGL